MLGVCDGPEGPVRGSAREGVRLPIGMGVLDARGVWAGVGVLNIVVVVVVVRCCSGCWMWCWCRCWCDGEGRVEDLYRGSCWCGVRRVDFIALSMSAYPYVCTADVNIWSTEWQVNSITLT